MPSDPVVSTAQTTEFNESSCPMEFLDSDKWPFAVFEEPMEFYSSVNWMHHYDFNDDVTHDNNIDYDMTSYTESIDNNKESENHVTVPDTEEKEFHENCIQSKRYNSMCDMIHDMFSEDDFHEFQRLHTSRELHSNHTGEFENDRLTVIGNDSEFVVDDDHDNHGKYTLEFYFPSDILDIYDIVYNDDKSDFTMVLNCSEEERVNHLAKCKLNRIIPSTWYYITKIMNDLKLRAEYVVRYKGKPVMAA